MLNTLLEIPVRYWRALSLLALFLLTLLSLLPLSDTGTSLGNDKVLHAIAWGLAVTPAALALGRDVLAVAGLFLAWSAGIELLQPLMGRDGEVADLVANAVGLVTGVLAGIRLRRWL